MGCLQHRLIMRLFPHEPILPDRPRSASSTGLPLGLQIMAALDAAFLARDLEPILVRQGCASSAGQPQHPSIHDQQHSCTGHHGPAIGNRRDRPHGTSRLSHISSRTEAQIAGAYCLEMLAEPLPVNAAIIAAVGEPDFAAA